MSEREWGGAPLFKAPLIQQQFHEPIKVERPVQLDAQQVIAPPVPDNVRAEAFNGADEPIEEHHAGAQSPPPEDAQLIAQLGLALYLLQELHLPYRPGFAHLDANPPTRKDREEQPGELFP